MQVVAWLRGIQARHGFTTEQLAAHAGMEPATMAAILSGQWSPPPATVALLEQHLQAYAAAPPPRGASSARQSAPLRPAETAGAPPRSRPHRPNRRLPLVLGLTLLAILCGAVGALLATGTLTAGVARETLALQAEAGADGVRLRWDPPPDGSQTLLLERRLTDGDAWTKVAEAKATDRGADDRLPPSNQPRTYTYRLRTVDGAAQSPALVVTVPAWDPALALATPTPLARPTVTARAATITGSVEFRTEVEAALRLLEAQYPAGFARYLQYARTLREDMTDEADLCGFTRTFAREIVLYRACVEAEPPGPERTRRVAAALVHEATHLLVDLAGADRMTPQLDTAWLRTKVAELTQQRRAQERERALERLDAERQAGYAECNRIIAEAEDGLQRVSGGSSSYAAAVRTTAVERAHGCRTDVDSRIGYSAGQRVEAAMARWIGRDLVADYVASQERREGERLTASERTTLVQSECWAQHEGLLAYTTLGGNSAAELRDLLFLAHPECRAVLRPKD